MLNFNTLVQQLIAFLIAALSGFSLLLAGCAPDSEAIERKIILVMERVVIPVTEKAIEEVTTQTATLQGGAQAIEPGWAFEVEGFWVTGFKGQASVRAVGLSGQLTGHAQGARDADVGKTEHEDVVTPPDG